MIRLDIKFFVFMVVYLTACVVLILDIFVWAPCA
jgi:hypothetical protein